MEQNIFNIIVGIAGALSVWWMTTIWSTLKELQREDKATSDKVAAIEDLVAGKYMQRDEFDRTIDRLFHKLDKIEGMLNGKQDK